MNISSTAPNTVGKTALNRSGTDQTQTSRVPNLCPIPFHDLQKALLEAENEPLYYDEDFKPINNELDVSFIEEESLSKTKGLENNSQQNEDEAFLVRKTYRVLSIRSEEYGSNVEEQLNDQVEEKLNTSFCEATTQELDAPIKSKCQEIKNPANCKRKQPLNTPARNPSTFSGFKTPNRSSNRKTPFSNLKSTRSQSSSSLTGDNLKKITEETPKNRVHCSIDLSSYKQINGEKLTSSKKVNRTILSRKSKPNEPQTPSNKENVPVNNVKVQFSLPKQECFDFKTIKVNATEYVVLNQIGRGGSSVVWFCYDYISKCIRAIKRVDLSGEQAESYMNEVNVLKDLQHCDRIIKMYDFEIIKSEEVMLVVLEYGDMDLSRMMKNLISKPDHIPMYLLMVYWMDMLHATKQIHDNGIIHSDLKPANFVLVGGRIKLIDFGIASSIQADCTSIIKDIARGSLNYISPEALTNEDTQNVNSPNYGKGKYKISYKTDVWSLGCILYQLVYKKSPFQHITNSLAKFNAIVNSDEHIKYPVVDWLPPRMLETIKSCLRNDMKSRPSIDELLRDYETHFNYI